MIYAIFSLCCVFIWPFTFCYCAHFTTNRISFIQNTIYNLDWHDFPIELQKQLVLIMAEAQTPLYFSGFGLIRCTLFSFLMVSATFVCQ